MVGGIRAVPEGSIETPSAGFVLAGGDHFAFFLEFRVPIIALASKYQCELLFSLFKMTGSNIGNKYCMTP